MAKTNWTGTAGDDTYSAAALPGEHELLGGEGNDTLEGGEGDDDLWGGAGADRFVFDREDSAPDGTREVVSHLRWTSVGENNWQLVWSDTGRKVTINERRSDIIHDFEDGLDTLVIKGGLKFSDLDIKQSGDDAVVSGPSDNFSIRIADFDASLLTESDFDFIA